MGGANVAAEKVVDLFGDSLWRPVKSEPEWTAIDVSHKGLPCNFLVEVIRFGDDLLN